VNGLLCPPGIAHGSAGCLTALVLGAAVCCGLPVGVVSAQAAWRSQQCSDPTAGGEGLVAYCRGLEKQDAGDVAGSVADLQLALKLNPERPEPHLLLGVAYTDGKDYVRALQEYDTYLAAVTDNPAGWSNRAVVHLKMGDLAAARRDIDRALDLAPHERQLTENRIVIAREAGDWPTVIADCSRLLEEFPNDAKLRRERAKALVNSGQTAAALDDFDRALVLEPTAEAYLRRGHANYLLGQHERAIADLSRAIELDSSLADAFRWRAYAEYRSQRYLTAVRDCGEYARLRPDESEGYYCRGIMLSRAGDHDAAIADYERAIERARTAEDAGNAWYGVGVCHERAGRTAEAVAAFRRTLEVYPEQSQAQSALTRLTRTK
jgi:tetratricopeptide (TPR) repeat protein